jgi:hypothetical protein
VTVFGDVSVNRLDATEALIQGTVRVLDNQHGCFRFSTAHDTPDKRMPAVMNRPSSHRKYRTTFSPPGGLVIRVSHN